MSRRVTGFPGGPPDELLSEWKLKERQTTFIASVVTTQVTERPRGGGRPVGQPEHLREGKGPLGLPAERHGTGAGVLEDQLVSED